MAFNYRSLPVVSAIEVNKPTTLVLGKTGTDIVVPEHKIGIGGNPAAKTDVLGRKPYSSSTLSLDGKIPKLSIDSLLLRNEEFIEDLKTRRRIIERKNSYFELEESFLQKLAGTLDNLNKFLSALSYKIHYLYQINKIEEQLLIKRHEQLKEFLNEKSAEAEDEGKKKPSKTDKEKLENLKLLLVKMGFVGSLVAIDMGVAVTGSYTVRGAAFAKQLMAKYGLTDIQAAAIFGVMSWESSLIPHNVENSSPYNTQEPLPPPYGATYVGYGWPQWTNITNTPGDRLNLFITKYLGGGPGKRGRAATDQDNMSYFIWELDNVPRFKSVIPDLKKQTTVEGAVNSFLNLYEGVPGNRVQERIQRTLGILQELRKSIGGIVIPELFGKGYVVKYDTESRDTTLSNFIVDRPTVIGMNQINEPLVIIPLEKPIGKTILNVLFRPIFDKIEQALNPIKKSILEKKPDSEKYKEPKNKNQALPQSKVETLNIPPTIDLKNVKLFLTTINENIIETQKSIIDIFDLPNIINISPELNLEQKKVQDYSDSIDIKTDEIKLIKQTDTKLLNPVKKSDIDTIDKLSIKTDILSEKKQNIVIFTRDIYV